eukprot:8217169-Ditylum_brightwellii.AAC.1
MLNYCYTHPNTMLQYLTSNMILILHLDASYLSEKNVQSRAAGYFYSSKIDNEEFNNGAILILSIIIKLALASMSEAELAALFYNARDMVPI